MEYLAGIVLALAVSLSATFVGLDRDRAFYPTVLAVIASYYGLFAVVGESASALIVESLAMAVFLAATVLGYRRNLWLVVAALFAHGVFDFFHGHVIANPGVPAWWPMFCLAYDVTAAAYLTWLINESKLAARATHVR
ncbi:MAG: hypothetical protein WC001_13325 [Desulfurivibrionaceae bacterium]|jgi:hypothetical protein